MPIVSVVGAPATFSAANGGKIYAYNNITEFGSLVIAPRNMLRQRIIFHNPGPNDLYVAPGALQNIIGTLPGTSPAGTPIISDHTFTPFTPAAVGGSFLVYGNGGTLEIRGECQNFWQAVSKTGAGTGNPLTVMESNT